MLALPSPKFQVYVFIAPSVSVEFDPSNVTVNGASPKAVEESMAATGSLFSVLVSLTVTVTLLELICPVLSVTVRTVVNVPAES